MPNHQSLAQKIARRKHAGQTRRDRVTPYIIHIERVAHRASSLARCVPSIGVDCADAAWLHDVLEDTDTTARELIQLGVRRSVVDAVVLLTKPPKGSEFSLEYYLEKIRDNDIARTVKIADMIDNLADDPTPAQMNRYVRGISYLLGHTNAPT